MKRCGFVAVLGETNAGKSTLVNRLVGQKVSIVSRKVQTTQDRILGVVIYEDSQIILIDTPGFVSQPHTAVAAEKTAWDAFRETDNVLFVFDAGKKNTSSSVTLLQKIGQTKKVSLVLNKVDSVHKPNLLQLAEMFSRIRNFENIFMVSGLNGSGVEDIKKYLANAVEDGKWLFPEDEITDMAFEKFASEITREHLYHRVHKEIPYKCRVVTESYKTKNDGSILIFQNIIVTTDAHKVILLGHDGSKIKAIGIASRSELTELFNRKIHLVLNVITEKK